MGEKECSADLDLDPVESNFVLELVHKIQSVYRRLVSLCNKTEWTDYTLLDFDDRYYICCYHFAIRSQCFVFNILNSC